MAQVHRQADSGGAGWDGDSEPVSTTYYFYNAVGNPLRVVTEPGSTAAIAAAARALDSDMAAAFGTPSPTPLLSREGSEEVLPDARFTGTADVPKAGEREYMAVRFGYAVNGTAVGFVMGERWRWDPDAGGDPTDFEITYAREFRYDGGRQRYLNRQLDPAALQESGQLVSLRDTWSDYSGDSVYADYSFDGGVPEVSRIYEPGVGMSVDPTAVAGTRYYHADHLGTTRFTSDGATGAAADSSSYEAFGAQIDGTNRRYGYAGAYGYQSHDIDEVAALDPPLDPATASGPAHIRSLASQGLTVCQRRVPRGIVTLPVRRPSTPTAFFSRKAGLQLCGRVSHIAYSSHLCALALHGAPGVLM